jgi:toxin YoeB
MTYSILYTPDSEEDIESLKMAGDKIALRKLERLIRELMEHPCTGTGKPKQLKGALSGCYSRRITDKHRLVYRIFDDSAVVLLLSVCGHYDDK